MAEKGKKVSHTDDKTRCCKGPKEKGRLEGKKKRCDNRIFAGKENGTMPQKRRTP